MNLCKECKHFSVDKNQCVRPHPVLGNIVTLDAYPERNASGHCGPRGHFWEPIEVVQVEAPKARKARAAKPVVTPEEGADGQE